MDIIDRIDKALFNNVLSETKMNIVSLIRDNDNITRLLKYNAANALNETNPITSTIKKEIYSQNSPNKRVFLSGFDGQAVEETRSEIHISFDSINPTQASTTKIPFLTIDVVVADAINVLDDGMSLRHDRLFQEICDTIEGYSVGTVGHIEMIHPARELVLLGNTHLIWSANYKVGEIKR